MPTLRGGLGHRMSEISKEELSNLRAGDKQAWEAFFARFNDLINSVVAWSKWRFAPPVREDVAQGIRLALFKAIDSFQQESSAEYYVKRICVNRCIDEVRRQVRTRQMTIPLAEVTGDRPEDALTQFADPTQDPLQEVIRTEVAGQVKRVLGTLDELCRVAIMRFYFRQESYQQMSDELKISINTVGSRLAKCLDKMRRLMSADPFFGEEIRTARDGR